MNRTRLLQKSTERAKLDDIKWVERFERPSVNIVIISAQDDQMYIKRRRNVYNVVIERPVYVKQHIDGIRASGEYGEPRDQQCRLSKDARKPFQ